MSPMLAVLNCQNDAEAAFAEPVIYGTKTGNAVGSLGHGLRSLGKTTLPLRPGSANVYLMGGPLASDAVPPLQIRPPSS